jgi:uncharacterized protein (DUF58 family)
MGYRGAAALALIVAGAFLRLPIVAILGIVAGSVELAHVIWARRGLTEVSYERRLARQRVNWGGEIELEIEVWNRKRLPLAWLRADDETSDGVTVRGQTLVGHPDIGLTLRNTWTLASYERVVRRMWISAERRGVFTIGPTELTVGDVFARDAGRLEISAVDRFIVWPRVVAAPGAVRPDRWGDLDRARSGLMEDPSRFAGIRAYAPGDPLKRIHARASARLGQPVTKRFEPARERQVLIALDVQTVEGRRWDISQGEETETLSVIAASLASSLAADGAAVGLTAAAFTRTLSRFADVPVSRGAGQAALVLDMLARLSPYPSAPFEVVLARLARRASSGTSVLVVTMRDPSPLFGQFRRLRRRGCTIAILACGPDAPAEAARCRAAGFGARYARLNAPWRTATRLVVST